MEQILFIREGIIRIYKKQEIIINFIAKFIVGLIVFSFISMLGHPNPDIVKSFPQISGMIVKLMLSLLFTTLPITPAYLLIILYIALQTSAILELCLIITLVLICILVFYVRMATRESILIILTVLAFYAKIPYFVPMLAGLYFSLTSIIPVIIGVFIWHFIPIINSLLATTKTAGFDIVELPQTFSVLYIEVLNSLSINNQWIFIAFIFAMVIIVVSVVSKLSIDYSKDVAVALGAAVAIISFIIAVLLTDMDISIFSIIFFTLLSAVLILLIRFFDCVLNYSRVERVEFEDDENYYYVKIVPKVLMVKRNKIVKRIRPSHEDFDSEYEV